MVIVKKRREEKSQVYLPARKRKSFLKTETLNRSIFSLFSPAAWLSSAISEPVGRQVGE